MTPTPPEPAYPYCVTITKPGHATVHLGFTFKHQAEHAAASLQGQLHHTAHPEGTTFGWGPTPDDVTPEPPLIAIPHVIAEQIAALDDNVAPGARFPDVYSRLVAQEGHEEAKRIWHAACRVLDEPDEEPETLPAEDLSPGVTAGYNWETDAWHVEVHTPGQPVEIVPIAMPQIADQEAAQSLAEQLAEHRKLPFLANPRGLRPADEVLDQVRAAAWVGPEGDADLVAEVARLHAFEQRAHTTGWARVTDDPPVVGTTHDGIQFDAAGTPVVAMAGQIEAITKDRDTWSPTDARLFGAAMIWAAKLAEDLQRSRDLEAADVAPKDDHSGAESDTA